MQISKWKPKLVKVIYYSEKATKLCELFTLLLTTVHTVKSKVKISQDFVAFSEYMNFKAIENIVHRNIKFLYVFKKIQASNTIYLLRKKCDKLYDS